MPRTTRMVRVPKTAHEMAKRLAGQWDVTASEVYTLAVESLCWMLARGRVKPSPALEKIVGQFVDEAGAEFAAGVDLARLDVAGLGDLTGQAKREGGYRFSQTRTDLARDADLTEHMDAPQIVAFAVQLLADARALLEAGGTAPVSPTALTTGEILELLVQAAANAAFGKVEQPRLVAEA